MKSSAEAMQSHYQEAAGHPAATRVSVVIPCRDGAPWLGAQLDALGAQDYSGPLEIIVADNGSRDASREIARSRPGVSLVDASQRPGPNHARNAGAGRATGEVILTCDADDLADSHWVSAMVEALREHDLVAGRLDYRSLNPSTGPEVEARAELHSRLGFLPTAMGANFGIRASVLRALGGWDDSFDGGPDDTDLCWRAQLAGYRFGWAEGAVVRYRLRPTAMAAARQAYEGGRRMPLLIHRFRRHGMPLRPIVFKAFRFASYIALCAPVAAVSPRVRREWLRRVALAVGFARGIFSRRRP